MGGRIMSGGLYTGGARTPEKSGAGQKTGQKKHGLTLCFFSVWRSGVLEPTGKPADGQMGLAGPLKARVWRGV